MEGWWAGWGSNPRPSV